MGFIMAVGVRVAGFAANTLAVKSASLTFLLYLLPLGAIVGALISLYRGARPHKRYSISEAISDRLVPLLVRLRLGRGRSRSIVTGAEQSS